VANAPAATSRFLSVVSGPAQGRANSAKNGFVCVVFLNFPRRLKCWPAITLAAGGPQEMQNGHPERQLQQAAQLETANCQLHEERPAYSP
jgi:hypothetical protein